MVSVSMMSRYIDILVYWAIQMLLAKRLPDFGTCKWNW